MCAGACRFLGVSFYDPPVAKYTVQLLTCMMGGMYWHASHGMSSRDVHDQASRGEKVSLADDALRHKWTLRYVARVASRAYALIAAPRALLSG